MKTLINKLAKKIILPLAVATAFAFNSYSQKVEKTEDGFKEYNKLGQMIRECEKTLIGKACYDYKYDKQGRIIERLYREDINFGDETFETAERWKYKYDSIGNVIEKKLFVDLDGNGLPNEFLKKY